MSHLEPQHIVSLLLGLLSLIGVCFTSWCSVMVKRDTKQINSAVNHVGPTGIRLYDAVIGHGDHLERIDQQVHVIDVRLDGVEAHLSNIPCISGKNPC